MIRITSTTTTTSDSARRPQGEARQLCAEGALAGEEPARLQELPAAALRSGCGEGRHQPGEQKPHRRVQSQYDRSKIPTKSK